MPDDGPRSKADVMQRITARWNELQAMLGALTPSEWEQPLGDGWSAKVHLAHIEAWERTLILLFAGERRDSAMDIDPALWDASESADAVNSILAARAESRSLAAVRKASDDTHAEVVGLLEALSEDDLAKPYSHYQPNDPPYNANPVYSWVNGDTWAHYEEHIGWLRAGLAAEA